VLVKLAQKLKGKVLKFSDKEAHKEFNRLADLGLRLRHEGVEFKGAGDLKNLQSLCEISSFMLDRSKLPNAIKGRGQFQFDWLEKGIEQAIEGLQKIADEKYKQYKAARRGGASHDDACTFHNPDDPGLCDRYKFRYELERYINTKSGR